MLICLINQFSTLFLIIFLTNETSKQQLLINRIYQLKIIIIMGNQITNFNPSYRLWSHYRANVNSIKQKQPNPIKNIQQNHTTKNIPQQVNSEKNIIQQKAATQKQIPLKISNKQVNKQNPSNNLVPVSPEVIRSKIPSVITGTAVAPMSEQMQKGSDMNFQKKISGRRVQAAGNNKLTSGHGLHMGIDPILVKDRNRSASQQRNIKFASKIDSSENLKVQVKSTRLRIDTIAKGQQKQYVWMLSQLDNEKKSGLPDRNKALFLIKESIDYEKLIVGLRTKRQIIVRILNDLNQHKLTQSMNQVVDEVNKYIDGVQHKFIKIDWRAIIIETAVNMQRYVDIITTASVDPEVLKKLEEMENQIRPKKQSVLTQEKKSNVSQQSHSSTNSNNKYHQANHKQPKLNEQKTLIKDNRMSHEIMIDSIQKMIAGESEKDLPVTSSNKQPLRTSDKIPSSALKQYGLVPPNSSKPNNNAVHQPESKAMLKQKLK